MTKPPANKPYGDFVIHPDGRGEISWFSSKSDWLSHPDPNKVYNPRLICTWVNGRWWFYDIPVQIGDRLAAAAVGIFPPDDKMWWV